MECGEPGCFETVGSRYDTEDDPVSRSFYNLWCTIYTIVTLISWLCRFLVLKESQTCPHERMYTDCRPRWWMWNQQIWELRAERRTSPSFVFSLSPCKAVRLFLESMALLGISAQSDWSSTQKVAQPRPCRWGIWNWTLRVLMVWS
jgi:hypothetical protein